MKQVLMLTSDYTENYEIMVPYQALQVAGVGVDMVYPDKETGDAIGTTIHDFENDRTYSGKPGHNFVFNTSFQYLKLEQYDGLFLTGGRAPGYLRLSPRVLDMIHYFMDLKKSVVAICHGVQVLTTTRVLKGKQVTAYPAVRPEVLATGDIFMEEGPYETVICDNLVTSPARPGNIEILRELLKLLGITALQ